MIAPGDYDDVDITQVGKVALHAAILPGDCSAHASNRGITLNTKQSELKGT
jgi:hypothetical protein